MCLGKPFGSLFGAEPGRCFNEAEAHVPRKTCRYCQENADIIGFNEAEAHVPRKTVRT